MEAPITPTCKPLLILAAIGLVATPSGARPLRIMISDGKLSTYVRARAASTLGQEGQAARLYGELARADRANGALGRRAVSSAIAAGDFALALEAARGLPKASLWLEPRLLLIAEALRAGRAAEGLALIEGLPETDGGFLAPVLRAWATGGPAGDAVLSTKAVGESVLSAFIPEQRALLLLADRRVAEARPLMTEALGTAEGRELRLRLAFSEALRKAGDKAGAADMLAQAPAAFRRFANRRAPAGIAIDTPAAAYAELLTGLALSLSQGQDRTLPIALAQVARLAAPDSSQATIVLALLLDQDQRSAEGLALLRSVPDSDPFYGDALDSEARLLVGMKRPAEAVAVARAALARLGNDAAAGDWSRLAETLDESGDHAGSAEAYARAIAAADAAGLKERWTYRLLRADQLDELDRWAEAKVELEAALKIAPDEPVLLNFLGYGKLEKGEDLDAAEAMVRKASALRPNDASITDSLGWALYKRGRLPEAIAALRAAAAGDPAQAEIHEHLGDALFKAGRRIEARFSWQAALVNAEDEARSRLEAKLVSGLTPATAAP